MDVNIERPMVQALQCRACICYLLAIARQKGSLDSLRAPFRLDIVTSIEK